VSDPDFQRGPAPPEHEHEHEHDQLTISRDRAERIMHGFYADMPTRKAVRRLADLYERLGPPFAIFLTFPGVDAATDDIEQQFHGHYFGSHSRDEVIQTGLEFGDHEVALERFLEERGLPDDALDWNFDALWPALREQFFMVREDHYFHVFDSVLAPPPANEQEADQ